MTLFGKTIVTRNYYVAEIIGGKAVKVTRTFNWRADAEAAKSRMRGGKFVVVEAQSSTPGTRKLVIRQHPQGTCFFVGIIVTMSYKNN